MPAKIKVVRGLEPKTHYLIVGDIPLTTKNAFRAICLKKGITMKQAIIQLMQNFIVRNQHSGMGPRIDMSVDAPKEL